VIHFSCCGDVGFVGCLGVEEQGLNLGPEGTIQGLHLQIGTGSIQGGLDMGVALERRPGGDPGDGDECWILIMAFDHLPETGQASSTDSRTRLRVTGNWCVT